MSHFNYIITCHNSETLIADVLHGVQRSLCGGVDNDGAACFAVLDGCTDRTAEIVRSFPWSDWVRTVETPDVHELLSINAGLRAAPQDGDGYNIILQDDVILMDPQLEAKVEKLYATIPQLGYVSFRLGFNLRRDAWSDAPPYPYLPQWEDIESVYGSGCTGNILMPGRFAYRTFPIKSPICIPCKLVREVGMLNEDLAPYAYDDLEYCIRTATAGYQNGVFALPFFSHIKWGGSRKPGHPDMMVAIRRNGAKVREIWRDEMRAICEREQSTEQVQVWPSTPEEDAAAMKQWNESVQQLLLMSRGL